ncbi:MAG: tRNA (adenosine(37)-N6)-threonylcarbamoyltransferase complex transferase subunit TsaD [Chloroflexota bacterium]
MLVLGIESSCDETSAAVVEDGRFVRSNIVSSQISLHAPFGGVVPEIASRQHVRVIVPVVRQALETAGVTGGDLGAVAATYGPGLAGSLLVGMSFGRAMALGLQVPFIPVNHLEGHVHSVWLCRRRPFPSEPLLPMLALVVSGGHTELILMRAHGDYRLLGRTLDDAGGEAFDKVARLLGLPYPGGPAIQQAAVAAQTPFSLPRAWLAGSYDFSFSGLKTATLHAARQTLDPGAAPGHHGSLAGTDLGARLDEVDVANIAAGFQDSVVDVLVKKTAKAAADVGAASVSIVGGVAANRALGERARAVIDRPLYVPGPEFCTDNAAMIASVAYFCPSSATGADVSPALELAPDERPLLPLGQ